MEIMQIFEIGQSGLDFQKLRMQAIALNMANAQTSSRVGDKGFQPLVAIGSSEVGEVGTFKGVESMELVERNVQARLKYDPTHPHSNSEGYIQLPAVNPVDEMTSLMLASRAYEANVSVMNAAKSMALKALEIGRS
ncbi:flagellar basal body rod protein FlgC [Hahella ganghwensis]|uniref:flagellar basal body rod protein FlgC n=1 Tax=Hahella ganghwensis TaxID=286420 RepID=UPI0003664343|nr:flagellar basal body rod protein FlgC [Hahella ganghwensis]